MLFGVDSFGTGTDALLEVNVKRRGFQASWVERVCVWNKVESRTQLGQGVLGHLFVLEIFFGVCGERSHSLHCTEVGDK